MNFCFANFRRKTSAIADVSTIDSGGTFFAIFAIFYTNTIRTIPSPTKEESSLHTNLIRIRVVNLIQSTYCRELLVDKGIDYKLDRLVGPLLEGLFEGEFIETPGDSAACRPVARELCLQGIDCCGLCCGCVVSVAQLVPRKVKELRT